MASPGVNSNSDVEAQNNVTEILSSIIASPPPTANTITPQLPTTADSRPLATNTNRSENAPAQQNPDNSEVQRDENHGDPSDGLWSIYLTEAEKEDMQLTESWKGDTDGILVFTGLFSATVAAFLIESYKKLSPDSGDTTNVLLTQISAQLVSISNGTSLASVAVQSAQPFKPTASAVRVNVLWFLSLVLSLSCALSATLMQQWARRYQELARRRGAFHRRGRMRAFIFDGINRFGMARAVATMPTLLHISVFLFFSGLVDFLFPIYTSVAYVTLGYIMVFALAYAILTVLPNIYLNCPYATPLSGITWRISHFSVMGFLWATLKIEGLLRKSLSKLWGLANHRALEPAHGSKEWRWRERLENLVKTRGQWFSQGMRKSVELSAYRADSTVVTSALVWTLVVLDEDKEIENFAAQVPGFFDSRVVPDATLAVLPLMSHQANTNPIFGSRLYDLLKTCIPETSTLDENLRKNRLRVCMKCLWSFAKAYNELGSSRVLPSYLWHTLSSPEITRRVRAEEDSSVRVIGRCFGALTVNKLAADLESRADPISDGELACLSAFLSTNRHDAKLFLRQPGAITFVIMIALVFETGGLVADTVPPGVLDVVQQTLDTLSRVLLPAEDAEVQLDQPLAIINGSDGKFERVLLSYLYGLLSVCIAAKPPLTEELLTCLRMCLKGLWYYGRAHNQPENTLVPLPSHICVYFASPEIIHRIQAERDIASRVIGHCFGALVVKKLSVDVNLRSAVGVQVSGWELVCLSTILGINPHDVKLLLSQPGAITFANMISFGFDKIGSLVTDTVPSGVLDVVQQTLGILSQTLLPEENPEVRLDQPFVIINDSDGEFERVLLSRLHDLLNVCTGVHSFLTEEVRTCCLRMCLKGLWYCGRVYNQPRNTLETLPSYVYINFASPEMTHRIQEDQDPASRVIGRCFGALVAKKFSADVNLRIATGFQVSDRELACLSAILGIESHEVALFLGQPGAIEFASIVSLTSTDGDSLVSESMPSDVLRVFKETFRILSHTLPTESQADLSLPESLVIRFYEIYSKARHWLKYELQQILDRLPTRVLVFFGPFLTQGSQSDILSSQSSLQSWRDKVWIGEATSDSISHAPRAFSETQLTQESWSDTSSYYLSLQSWRDQEWTGEETEDVAQTDNSGDAGRSFVVRGKELSRSMASGPGSSGSSDVDNSMFGSSILDIISDGPIST